MIPDNEYSLGRGAYNRRREESAGVVAVIIVLAIISAGAYILVDRYHIRPVQLVFDGELKATFVM